MNFSTVSGLTIPEGTVTKITNASGRVLWEKNKIVPYLTFSSPNTFSVSVDTFGWDGTMEYSTDKTTWATWNGGEISGEYAYGDYAVYFRGTGNTVVTGPNGNISRWYLNGSNISCDGNVETLLDYATVQAGSRPTMGDRCYCAMFHECTSLITAPELPATTLASGCYSAMFFGCTSLTTAPALPATTLADYCYDSMFYGCASIKVSETQTGTYTQPYRIPTSGTGTTASDALISMFTGTGGTFTGTPTINTTYYLHESNTIVPAS